MCVPSCVLHYVANMAVVASLFSVAVSSTTLLAVAAQCLLDCSNQYDLKRWLMLIISRHGELFSSACLEGMAL